MQCNYLDQEINVSDPFRPEKGGYQAAFMNPDRYEALGPDGAVYSQVGLLHSSRFDSGLKLSVPKLDLTTGKQVHMRFEDMLCLGFDDIRVLRYSEVQALGLQLKAPAQQRLEQLPFAKRSSLLVGLDALQDEGIVEAFNHLAKLKQPHLPAFSDEAFAFNFKLLDDYLNYFNLQLQPTDYVAASLEGMAGSYEHQDTRFNERLFSMNYEALELHNNATYAVKMPVPTLFRTEKNFLRAGAQILAMHIWQGFNAQSKLKQPIIRTLSHKDRDFLYHHAKSQTLHALIIGLTGCMFATRLGAGISLNDINWFNSYHLQRDDLVKAFNYAAVACKALSELFLSESYCSINGNLWQYWKSSYKNLALQQATPSLPEIARCSHLQLNQDNLMHSLHQFISTKAHTL